MEPTRDTRAAGSQEGPRHWGVIRTETLSPLLSASLPAKEFSATLNQVMLEESSMSGGSGPELLGTNRNAAA